MLEENTWMLGDLRNEDTRTKKGGAVIAHLVLCPADCPASVDWLAAVCLLAAEMCLDQVDPESLPGSSYRYSEL